MDILTTKHFSKDTVKWAISENETNHPDRKKENDEWREWLRTIGNEDLLKEHYPNVDIDAGFISSCRSDYMSCGACKLRKAISELRVRELRERTQ